MTTHRGSLGDRMRTLGVRWLGARPAFLAERWSFGPWARATWRFRRVRKPIFMWGCGRTGSYLLYDLLSLHRDLIMCRQSTRLSKGLYGSHHHGGGEYDHLLANPFPPIEGASRLLLSRFPQIQKTGRWEGIGATEIRKWYQLMAAYSVGRRRLIDKAPKYTFLVDLLEGVFPDAQHVHCLRDPRAVAAGYIRRMAEPDACDEEGFWSWRPTGWQDIRGRSLEDRATWLVIKTIRQGLENHAKLGERCIEARYETIIAQPRQELERVLSFLGLTPDLRLLDDLPKSFPNYNRPPSALNAVSPDLRDELEELSSELGYPPAGLASTGATITLEAT